MASINRSLSSSNKVSTIIILSVTSILNALMTIFLTITTDSEAMERGLPGLTLETRILMTDPLFPTLAIALKPI